MNTEQTKQIVIEALEFVSGKRKSPPSNIDTEQAIDVLNTSTILEAESALLIINTISANKLVLERGIAKHSDDIDFQKIATEKLKRYQQILDFLSASCIAEKIAGPSQE